MSAESTALVCPGCKQPTDPSISQCEHCHYLHLGWLDPAPSEPSGDPLAPLAESSEEPESDADTAHTGLIGFLNRHEQRIGGIYVSLISGAVLVGGLLLHNHYEPHKKLCESGVGVFAQGTSSSVLKHCSLDSFLAEMGVIIAIFSGLVLGVGLLAVVLTAIVARQQRSASDQ